MSRKAELGSAENPIKLYFTPSVDAKVIEDNAKTFKDYLEKNTPYKYSVSVPQSYIAVVESFGTKRADVAAINTYSYLQAHERFGAQARLTVLRHGSDKYQSQILVKADSAIKTVRDLEGKRVAFVDASSTSGYLLPMKMLKDANVKPQQIVFAGKHDSVVTMIYQGAVDAGATFYSPPDDGEVQDARRLVRVQYPDVVEKIKILQLSEAIPNDPIIFREGMPEAMKEKIAESFLAFAKTPEGRLAFGRLYGVTDLRPSTDAEYEGVRQMMKTVGDSVDRMLKSGGK